MDICLPFHPWAGPVAGLTFTVPQARWPQGHRRPGPAGEDERGGGRALTAGIEIARRLVRQTPGNRPEALRLAVLKQPTRASRGDGRCRA